MALEILQTPEGELIFRGSGLVTEDYFKAVNTLRAENGQHQEGAEEYFGRYDVES